MKKADIKNGQALVYCRQKDGPLSRDWSRYHAATVIDRDHEKVYQGYGADKAVRVKWAGVRGSDTDGVLIEYEGSRAFVGRPGEMRKVREVVSPRFLYDMDIAEIDEEHQRRRAARLAANARSNAEHTRRARVAEQNRAQLLVLGVDFDLIPREGDRDHADLIAWLLEHVR